METTLFSTVTSTSYGIHPGQIQVHGELVAAAQGLHRHRAGGLGDGSLGESIELAEWVETHECHGDSKWGVRVLKPASARPRSVVTTVAKDASGPIRSRRGNLGAGPRPGRSTGCVAAASAPRGHGDRPGEVNRRPWVRTRRPKPNSPGHRQAHGGPAVAGLTSSRRTGRPMTMDHRSRTRLRACGVPRAPRVPRASGRTRRPGSC